MKTKVTFEVLVTENGNIVSASNSIEWHHFLEHGVGMGTKVEVELRDLVVEGGLEDAHRAALSSGGAWWKNMKYKTVEQ